MDMLRLNLLFKKMDERTVTFSLPGGDNHVSSTSSDYHMQEILNRILPQLHGREHE
jgi:hypothetical protein